MYTLRQHPPILSGEMLDEYLAKGWFRMGQSVFTCRFLFFDSDIYTTIWTRLDLKKHQFSHRHRKLMNRNSRQFTYSIQKADITPEKELLYQSYMRNFKGRLAPTIASALMDDRRKDIFNTMEVTIYDGETLVGFSFFDLGETSIESIKGVYHPDYKQHSIGFYTMLLEVQYAMEHGYAYYYPGYVTPGYSVFDYKLRIGEVDFFDNITESWLPYHQLEDKHLTHRAITKKLLQLSDMLKEVAHIDAHLYLYPPYELEEDVFYPIPEGLKMPMFLELNLGNSGKYFIASTYDLHRNRYLLYRYNSMDVLSEFYKGQFSKGIEEKKVFTHLLMDGKLLYHGASPEELIMFILLQLSGGRK